ncbi:MAG TPA: diguanylate cyclase [Solirubrobacteraceae bacterium]|nr:diguanylate cyclase [Solirubrobacteraceae bacterium]
MSVRRVALLAMIAVVLIACAAYGAGQLERDSAVTSAQRMQQSQNLLTALLDEETGARGYFETSRRALLAPWYGGEAKFAGAVAGSRRLDAGDPQLGGNLAVQVARADAWHTAVSVEIERQLAGGGPPRVDQALADKSLFDRFRGTNAAYLMRLVDRRDSSLATANWLAAGLIGVLTIVLVLIAVLAAHRGATRAGSRAGRQRELRELLQVSASQSESQKLLIRHIERIVPGSAAAVLDRKETDDRLEAVVGGDVPAGPLQGVQIAHLRRRACMAVRLSRTYERRPGADPLLECEVCGRLAGEVACEPLLVGGQVIGAVLVAHEKRVKADQRTQVRESVVQAAPILANQRNLELAEWRAASDALTGLPNRRAADETIRRLTAHAGRTLSPLGVLLLDLDRFKQINDRHGHEHGDQALAIVGQVLTASIRASDFAARYGGEEFLILLPDTDRRGAIEVAEKIRHAIEHAEMPVIGGLTGSLGVAALPEDAVDPDQLIRKADRALYAAKARGRNRVEPAQPSGAEGLRSDEDDLLGGPGGALGES